MEGKERDGGSAGDGAGGLWQLGDGGETEIKRCRERQKDEGRNTLYTYLLTFLKSNKVWW